jgi:ADP-ribose pyrophosphatase YjhB (NUDIX family)
VTVGAPHSHVVVRSGPDEVILIRRVRRGREYFIVPGVVVELRETPGAAAARAAREELGIEVFAEELVYAQVFAGADHFFFMATAQSEPTGETRVPDHDDFELESELEGSYEITRLRTTQLLAYDVRPPELARRISRAVRA